MDAGSSGHSYGSGGSGGADVYVDYDMGFKRNIQYSEKTMQQMAHISAEQDYSERIGVMQNGGWINGMNSAAYALGTTTSIYESGLTKQTSALEKILPNAYANRRVIEKTISLNKVMIQTTRAVGKSLFGVGVVLSIADMHKENYSNSSITWALLDTGMGALGFVPGLQLVSGVYFAGRVAYQVYDSIEKTKQE